MDAILRLIDSAGFIIAAYFILTAVGSTLVVLAKYKNAKKESVVSQGPVYRPRIRPFNKAQLRIINEMPHPDSTEDDSKVEVAA